MATPKLNPDQIALVSRLVCQYITAQRGKYAARAVPLSAQQRAPLEPFFAPEVLDYRAVSKWSHRPGRARQSAVTNLSPSFGGFIGGPDYSISSNDISNCVGQKEIKVGRESQR